MKNYLTLLRKSDFTDLFKFGYLYIDTMRVVEFDGNVSSLSQNLEIRDRLFNRMNQFDYSFTVLLVYFRSNLKNGKLNIEEVQNIFALDYDAKREIEISYDPRIRIDNPIWPDSITKLQERFLFEDATKGALNLWTILKIDQPLSEIDTILSEEEIKEIAFEVQNDRRPEGNLSFWIYLLRYERHGFFPKNTVGFFMDLVNVYINAMQQREIPAEAIENTGIYKRLLEFQDCDMVSLIERLAETEEGRNFFDKVNELSDTKTNSFIIAILFLILKSRYSNGFNLNEKNALDYSKEKFPEEINYALYLLGVFLGNSHTFECLYDTLPLPVFKEVVQKPIISIDEGEGKIMPTEEGGAEMTSFPQKIPDVDNGYKKDVHSDSELGDLFMETTDNSDISTKQAPTKWVRKAGTTGKKGTKKVRDDKHFYELLSQGYIPVSNYGYLTD